MLAICSDVVFCPFCGCADLKGGLGAYKSKCPECGAIFMVEETDDSKRDPLPEE